MYEQPYNPFVKNLTAVKDYFKTPFTLFLSLAHAVSAILSLVVTILLATKSKELIAFIRDYILYLCDELDAPAATRSRITEAFNELHSSSVPEVVLSAVPALLITLMIAAAFLMIWSKSRREDPASSPIAGVSVLYVFSIISLVGAILVTVGVALIFVFLFWAYATYASSANLRDIPLIGELTDRYPEINDMDSTVFLVVIIALLFVAAIAVFLILFTAINKKRYYKSVKDSLSTVELQNKGAKPYGVMCVIFAVSQLCTLLSGISLLFPPHLSGKSNPFLGVTILLLLSIAASGVAYVFEAKLALGYRKHIDAVKYGYHTPSAPAPYAPFSGGAGFYPPQNLPQNNPYARYTPPIAPPAAPEAAPFSGAEAPAEAPADTANAYADPYGADAPEKAEPAAEPDTIAAAPAATEILSADDGTEEPADASAEPAQAAETAAEEPPVAPTCPLCGAEVDPTASFCGNCGNRL